MMCNVYVCAHLIYYYKIGQAAHDIQSTALTREITGVCSSLDNEMLEDLGRHADLYIFNQDFAQDM